VRKTFLTPTAPGRLCRQVVHNYNQRQVDRIKMSRTLFSRCPMLVSKRKRTRSKRRIFSLILVKIPEPINC